MRITSSSTSPWSNRREKRAQMRNEAKANATATTRPLALPLSFSLWFLPKVFARFETPAAASTSTSTASVLLPPSCVFGILFWFYTFSNYAHTNKHTNICMCVQGKSFCFCFPCSRRSRHCDQSGKICYMRFYRTSSLYSLPFVEGEPPVRLSVCVRECVYTCVLFI